MHKNGWFSIRPCSKRLYLQNEEQRQNILNQKFNVSHSNEVWGSDVTYFRYNNKMYYICVILDLPYRFPPNKFHRRVVITINDVKNNSDNAAKRSTDNILNPMSTRIAIHHRVIITIRIQVISYKRTVRTKKLRIICADETSDSRIIVSTLQIVEPGFRVIVITTVTYQVVLSKRACILSRNGKHIAPCVIGVFHNRCAIDTADLNDIPLQISHIVILRSIVDQRVNLTYFSEYPFSPCLPTLDVSGDI